MENGFITDEDYKIIPGALDGRDVAATDSAIEKLRDPDARSRYRIRKLTPRECWRLMGFKDEDYEKAENAVSPTQRYKQAGNSIVRPVLMAIFSQLHIKGAKAWNDMTDDERYALIGEPKGGANGIAD